MQSQPSVRGIRGLSAVGFGLLLFISGVAMAEDAKSPPAGKSVSSREVQPVLRIISTESATPAAIVPSAGGTPVHPPSSKPITTPGMPPLMPLQPLTGLPPIQGAAAVQVTVLNQGATPATITRYQFVGVYADGTRITPTALHPVKGSETLSPKTTGKYLLEWNIPGGSPRSIELSDAKGPPVYSPRSGKVVVTENNESRYAPLVRVADERTPFLVISSRRSDTPVSASTPANYYQNPPIVKVQPNPPQAERYIEVVLHYTGANFVNLDASFFTGTFTDGAQLQASQLETISIDSRETGHNDHLLQPGQKGGYRLFWRHTDDNLPKSVILAMPEGR